MSLGPRPKNNVPFTPDPHHFLNGTRPPMKLTKLLNLVSPDRREPQLCEACHQPFTCGFGLTGCWCAQVKLSETTRRRLGAQYRRCLCRACLEKAEAGGKEG